MRVLDERIDGSKEKRQVMREKSNEGWRTKNKSRKTWERNNNRIGIEIQKKDNN